MAAAGNWKSKLAVRITLIPISRLRVPDPCSQVNRWLRMRAGCLCGGPDLCWHLSRSICSAASSVRRSRTPGTYTGSHTPAATAAAGSMLRAHASKRLQPRALSALHTYYSTWCMFWVNCRHVILTCPLLASKREVSAVQTIFLCKSARTVNLHVHNSIICSAYTAVGMYRRLYTA
jgi:hypothetical protein